MNVDVIAIITDFLYTMGLQRQQNDLVWEAVDEEVDGLAETRRRVELTEDFLIVSSSWREEDHEEGDGVVTRHPVVIDSEELLRESLLCAIVDHLSMINEPSLAAEQLN